MREVQPERAEYRGCSRGDAALGPRRPPGAPKGVPIVRRQVVHVMGRPDADTVHSVPNHGCGEPAAATPSPPRLPGAMDGGRPA